MRKPQQHGTSPAKGRQARPHREDPRTIALDQERLIAERRKRGESQAAAAHRAGISIDTLSKAERGARIRLGSAEVLAKAYNLELAELVPGGSDRKLSKNELGTIRISSLSINRNKSKYSLHKFDPTLPMHPGEKLISFLPNGKIRVYDCDFDEAEDANRYSIEFDRRHNYFIFSWLSYVGLSPQDVAIAIAIDKHFLRNEEEEKLNASKSKYPFIILSIVNTSSNPIIIDAVSCVVHGVIPTKAVWQSEVLNPVGSYNIRISNNRGKYSEEISPPIKIAPADATAIEVIISPLDDQTILTGVLITQVLVHFDGQVVASPPLLMVF